MYILMVLAVVAVVILDQLSKLWVVQNIEIFGFLEAIPGLFHLTYVQNTGAAFSSFEGFRWLLSGVFVLFAGLVIWEFSKKKLPFSGFDRWCIVFVFAGGLGNAIDRIRLGYVVDMVELEFIRFPVFNLADGFISCGCILLILHMIFFNKDFWKEEKK